MTPEEWKTEFGDHTECPVCGTDCMTLSVEGWLPPAEAPAQPAQPISTSVCNHGNDLVRCGACMDSGFIPAQPSVQPWMQQLANELISDPKPATYREIVQIIARHCPAMTDTKPTQPMTAREWQLVWMNAFSELHRRLPDMKDWVDFAESYADQRDNHLTAVR